MEKCKDSENGWIGGWCWFKNYKDGDMIDGYMDSEKQRRQEWMGIWITPAGEVQKLPFVRLKYGWKRIKTVKLGG